jgi:SAM-dependent methyltransferase
MADWYREFFDRSYVELLKDQKPPRDAAREVSALERLMKLPPGARILDVACGFGRHSAEFARRGYRVVGVDLSRAMLSEARRLWRRPNLRFRRADMRRLPFRTEFDAALCLFTSFGYFSETGNRRALRSMVRALKPGGLLVVDHRNPAWHDAHSNSRTWWTVGKRWYVCESGAWDRRRRRVHSRWRVIDLERGRVIPKVNRIHFYSVASWRRLLRASGARLIRACSTYQGGRPGVSRPRLVILARAVP